MAQWGGRKVPSRRCLGCRPSRPYRRSDALANARATQQSLRVPQRAGRAPPSQRSDAQYGVNLGRPASLACRRGAPTPPSPTHATRAAAGRPSSWAGAGLDRPKRRQRYSTRSLVACLRLRRPSSWVVTGYRSELEASALWRPVPSTAIGFAAFPPFFALRRLPSCLSPNRRAHTPSRHEVQRRRRSRRRGVVRRRREGADALLQRPCPDVFPPRGCGGLVGPAHRQQPDHAAEHVLRRGWRFAGRGEGQGRLAHHLQRQRRHVPRGDPARCHHQQPQGRFRGGGPYRCLVLSCRPACRSR